MRHRHAGLTAPRAGGGRAPRRRGDRRLPARARSPLASLVRHRGRARSGNGPRAAARRRRARSLNLIGLPEGITACLFDLDGVLTPTAKIHAQAWKRVFDEFLRARSTETGEAFKPFDEVHDYDEYVDGKPRADGVRSFLESRRMTLPEPSVADLAERKDALVLELIHSHRLEPYPSSPAYLPTTHTPTP